MAVPTLRTAAELRTMGSKKSFSFADDLLGRVDVRLVGREKNNVGDHRGASGAFGRVQLEGLSVQHSGLAHASWLNSARLNIHILPHLPVLVWSPQRE
jgi:hypothetical protein